MMAAWEDIEEIRVVTKQSRRASFIEASTNIAAGFGLSYAANLIVLPIFGFQVSAGEAGIIAIIFTVISLGRSYFLRRAFEAARVRGIVV